MKESQSLESSLRPIMIALRIDFAIAVLYYVVWPVFVLATYVIAFIYQLAMLSEWIPEPLQAILSLHSKWNWVPPTWILCATGLPMVCAVAVFVYRIARRKTRREP